MFVVSQRPLVNFLNFQMMGLPLLQELRAFQMGKKHVAIVTEVGLRRALLLAACGTSTLQAASAGISLHCDRPGMSLQQCVLKLMNVL